MSSSLRVADWPGAARLALWCASIYENAAQHGLTAALAGARTAKQDSGTVADVLHADNRPSTTLFLELLHLYWQGVQEDADTVSPAHLLAVAGLC